MKNLSLVLAATTLAAFAQADMIQINNPTAGTVWTAGVANFVGWTGNCASMGEVAKNVTVDLNTGPYDAVRYVATLGTLDCSSTNTRTDLTVPLSVSSGTYSIVVRTAPQMSYTNMFTINNPSLPPTDTNSPPTAPGANGTNSGSNTPSTGSTGGKGSGAVKTSPLCQVLASVGLAAFTAAQFLL